MLLKVKSQQYNSMVLKAKNPLVTLNMTMPQLTLASHCKA